MNSQRGKITLMSLITFVILAFGVFMAFKYIGTSLEKKQIKKEVFDTLGNTRGGDMGNAEIMDLIDGILKKKKVEVLEVSAEVDRTKSIIHYSFKYKIDTDYFLFKRSEIVSVVEQIENYG
jgi:hypothetical protein